MSVTDPQIRAFVLRQLPTADWAMVHDAILTEDDVAERVGDEEFDVLDDYAAGRLNAADRAAVQLHLLGSDHGANSYRVAQALRQLQGGPHPLPNALKAPAPRPWAALRDRRDSRPAHGNAQRVAMVATFLAAGIAAVVLIPAPGGPPSIVAVTNTANAQLMPDAVTAAKVVTLLADLNRGVANRTVTITAAGGPIRLQAEATDPQADVSYTLTVEDALHRREFQRSSLTTRVAGPYRFVEALIPAQAFGVGTHYVSLEVTAAPGETAVKTDWQVVVTGNEAQ